jgi:hypothetical protein
MQKIDAQPDAPDGVNWPSNIGIIVASFLIFGIITPKVCGLSIPWVFSRLPTVVRTGESVHQPAFIFGIPDDLRGIDRDSPARLTIQECTPNAALVRRTLWEVTEFEPGATWRRPRWRDRFIADTAWFSFPYGHVPLGWNAAGPPAPLEEGVPYLATLRLDRKNGGRIVFIIEGGQFRFARGTEWSYNRESCAAAVSTGGVWQRT